MRTIGQFRAMTAEERAAERVHLQAHETELANAEKALDRTRAELDARLEAQYKDLEKLNKQAEDVSRSLHDVRQDLAGCLAAEKQIETEQAGQATGTGVTAGAGLNGGGTSGSVTLNVGQGTGIVVAGGTVSLDTTATDARYLKKTGDTMSGTLDMANNRVIGRGCMAGYVVVGPGLCTESVDGSGFTFTGCANRCRAAGTHMCTSAETRAIVAGGTALGDNPLLDWMDDQDAAGSALYVSNFSGTDITDSARATSTSSYCRCCESTE